MNVFIHVGMQKTGTSALQNVFEKIDGLQYFHYFNWYTKIDGDMDVLFSNEDLCGHPLLPDLDRWKILDNLHYVFPDAKVIVGLREDKQSWDKSMYKECVRQGYSKSFKHYKLERDPSYLNYSDYTIEITKRFKDIFIYTFENLKLDFDFIVKDLCDFMDKKIPCYDNHLINSSLTDGQVKMLRFINRFCKSAYNQCGMFRFAPRCLLSKIRN